MVEVLAWCTQTWLRTREYLRSPQVVGQVRKSHSHQFLQVSSSSRSPERTTHVQDPHLQVPLSPVSSPADPAAQVSHRSRRATPLCAAVISWRRERLDQFDHQSCTGRVSSFISITDESFIQTFYFGTPVMFNKIEYSIFKVFRCVHLVPQSVQAHFRTPQELFLLLS